MEDKKRVILSSAIAASFIVLATMSCSAQAQGAEPHGWLNTETLKTRSGDFEFKNGYPAGDTAATTARTAEVQSRGRSLPDADDACQRDRPAGRPAGVRREEAHAGRDLGKPDGCADGAADREHRDRLRAQPSRFESDGPTVVEAPPHMLGFIQDGLQRYLVDIGPLGPDKGKGGKFLVLPPGFAGSLPDGYFVARSPTYSVTFAVAGLPGRRQDRSGRRADEADQDLSARQGVIAAADGVHERLPAGHRHGVPRQFPLLRIAGDAGRRGAAG